MDRSTLNARLNEAASHYANARYHEALDGYTAILAEHPAHPDALNDAGMTHYQLGNAETAIEHFEKALEHDPSYEGAFFNLLDVTLETDGPEQAATCFETYGDAIPESVEKTRLHVRLAVAQQPLIGPEGTPNLALIETLQEQWGNEGWAASSEYVAYMAEMAAETDRPILECGSGLSTAILALVSKQTGVEVWTFEHHPEWHDRVQTFLKRLGLSKHINLRLTPLRDYGSYEWYTPPAEDLPNNFGLVVCDGPPGTAKGGRYGLLPIMRDALDSNCYILLDDVSRMGEQRVLQRWASETQISQESTEERTEFALFRMLAPQAPTPDAEAPPSTASRTDRLRVGFVCGPDRKFIGDIKREMSKRHDVRTAYFDESLDLPAVQRVMDWADVTWFEWCDKVMVNASQKLKKTSAVVCRLHGYEVFAGLPAHVDWSFVDQLIFVARHKRDIFNDSYKNVPTNQILIRNGVNLNTFSIPQKKENTKHLLLLGNLNYRKGLPMLMHFYNELLSRDPDFHLTIRGTWQDLRYKIATMTMIDELGLENKITFVEDWIENLNEWLSDKSHILSFSLEESFHYTIGEGMAAGLKPVIHAWNESRDIWPEEFIFHNLDTFIDITCAETYTPEAYRQFVETHFPMEQQVEKIDRVLRDLAPSSNVVPSSLVSQSEAPAAPPSVRYWEKRYSAGGTSGAGSYGRLAKFKADVINTFVREHDVETVIDLGCGDGNQLKFADYPAYHGLDVSETAIQRCRKLFADDDSKRFSLYIPDRFSLDDPAHSAELALSLDVIYHLLEDHVFDTYMRHLFGVAEKYVIIYSNDSGENPSHLSPHLRFRKFSDWINDHAPSWKLIDRIENPYPLAENPGEESFCDFFIYENQNAMSTTSSATSSSHSTPASTVHENTATLSIEGLNHPVRFANTSFSRPYVAQYASGYELDLVKMLHATVTAGATFVDIGAHLGYFTLLAAHRGAHVHAFEPNPRSFEHLKQNVALNDVAATVDLHQAAMGDHDGEVSFYEKANLDAGASIYQHVERNQILQGRSLGNVTMRDAADALQMLALNEQSVIKIDIEGAEYSLLPHVARVLQSTHPTLLVEFHPFNLVDSSNPYLNQLNRLTKNVKVAQCLNFYKYIYYIKNNRWHCVDQSDREHFFYDHFIAPKTKENIRSRQVGFMDNYVFSDTYLL